MKERHVVVEFENVKGSCALVKNMNIASEMPKTKTCECISS